MTQEHIVPHSLGNDLIVLAPGWVCDSCNNICSSFESRILSGSILGVERCRLGVITKKKKPATAKIYGISIFAEPLKPFNHVSVEADLRNIPLLINASGTGGKIVFSVHDKTNQDIARLLLKMAIELFSVIDQSRSQIANRSAAKAVVLGRGNTQWPYFLVLDGKCPDKLVSVFELTPDVHDYVRSCGFDLYLLNVDNQEILFFEYGFFFAGISVSSPDPIWSEVLKEWGVSFVGCPIEYARTNG